MPYTRQDTSRSRSARRAGTGCHWHYFICIHTYIIYKRNNKLYITITRIKKTATSTYTCADDAADTITRIKNDCYFYLFSCRRRGGQAEETASSYTSGQC